MSAQETVEVEQGFAPRVAILTAVAGLFPIIGTLVMGPLSNPPKNFAANLLYFHWHSSSQLAGSFIKGVGLLCIVVPTIFLIRATLARGGSVPRVTPALAIIGAVILCVTTIFLAALEVSVSSDFFSKTGLTYSQAQSLFKGQAMVAASGAQFLGSVAVAFGLAMASLNAMRVGLLTRFLGYIGILAGVMIAIPVFSPLPVIQGFWFLAIAAIIGNKWPQGRPPAWDDGEAHPWPSASESRTRAAEQREASKNGKPA